MTQLPGVEGAVPEWDQADRMRKALRAAGVQVQEIAEYLGVTRAAVGTWINGRYKPSTQTLRLWAMRCGVPYEWLRDGTVPGSTGPDGWAPRGSNPQLTDYKSATSGALIIFPQRRLLAAAA